MKNYLPILILSSLFLACAKDEAITPTPASSDFKAYSSAFTNGGSFPVKYTCDGASTSPLIQWSGAPAGTVSYAITMHHFPSASAEKHVYMCVYNIASSAKEIGENVTNIGNWGINTVNGKNAYSPPCSQGPGAKAYIITVYALSSAPVISTAPSATTMDVVVAAMSGKLLAKSEITVNYTRL
ncbi:MAG: YbhB/YbcL family Raf kinase inhibitor-like protein [Cytophagales bacterium]|nr:YbhB/YbcL family Raf kinase inhibitor-like protein [Cytophagales bacterium]